MKNHSDNKKLVIAYIGTKSVLAKSFVKSYNRNFILKLYLYYITDQKNNDGLIVSNSKIKIRDERLQKKFF